MLKRNKNWVTLISLLFFTSAIAGEIPRKNDLEKAQTPDTLSLDVIHNLSST